MYRLWVAVGVAALGCGRIGFDPGSNAGQCFAEPEVCNGRDDDCDQLTDEGCPCSEQNVTLASAPYASRPDIVWSGDGYGLAWIESDGTTSQLRFARLDVNGALVTAPVVLPAAMMTGAVELVWTGERFLVEWIDVEAGPAVKIKTLAIEADGTYADPIVIAAPGYDPSLVALGDSFAVVHTLTEPLRLAMKLVDDRGAVLDTAILVTDGALLSPRGAASLDRLGVTVVTSGSPSQLWFQAYSHAGAQLVAPIPIGPGATRADGHAIAWTGRDYAISWVEEDYSLRHVTVSAEGMVGTERVLGSGIQYVDSAQNGSELVLAWYGFQNAEFQVGIARLDAMGGRLAPDRFLGSSAEAVGYPRLTVATGRIGVTWMDSDGPDTTAHVRFAQLCP